MPSSDETISSLAATLVSVEKSQDEAREFNMNSFKRIMERLDLVPPMQTQIAVMTERISHLNENFLSHVKDDEKLTDQVEDLRKDGWIRKGIVVAVSGIVGFVASFLHK